MSVLTRNHCLVLNKNWTPVGTVTVQRAIIMVFSTYDNGEPKAKIIDHSTFQAMTWEDWAKIQPLATDEKIAAANMFFAVPKTIILTRYEKLPRPKAHFSRRTLLKRDGGVCQYCGCKCNPDDWTVDHVVPRSHGGLTTWENCVVCCVECNRKKANRTPRQANMKLMKEPRKPPVSYFRFDTLKPIKTWAQFLGEAYHNVELENDNKD